MVLSLLASAFGFALLGVSALRAWHRHRAARSLVIAGTDGIVASGFVRIGGIEQWLSIRGEHVANPILLLLHGGPASTYGMFTPLLRGW
jgi:hypothetical protein